MPTFEVDDQFHAHPKADAAGLEAIGLWVIAGSWCAGYLTDGRVPRGRALKMGSVSLWTRLVEVGLVEVTEDGYRLHDYLHWNRSAAEIASDRVRATEKKRDQRARKRALSKCGGNGPMSGNVPVSPGDTMGDSAGDVPPPVPASHARAFSPAPSQARSDPEKPPVAPLRLEAEDSRSRKRSRAKKPCTTLPEGWAPTEANYKLALERRGFDRARVDTEAELFRMKALAKSWTYADWAAGFSSWLTSEYTPASRNGGRINGSAHQPGKCTPVRPIEEILAAGEARKAREATHG